MKLQQELEVMSEGPKPVPAAGMIAPLEAELLSSTAAAHLEGFPAGTPGLSLACRDRADATFSAYRVFSFARDCGLSAAAAWEAATAAAQLTSTLVRFAGSGTLLVRWLEAPRVGLEMVASAELADGTTVPGLGSVRRLLSEVEVQNSPAGPTRVVGRKWVA